MHVWEFNNSNYEIHELGYFVLKITQSSKIFMNFFEDTLTISSICMYNFRIGKAFPDILVPIVWKSDQTRVHYG